MRTRRIKAPGPVRRPTKRGDQLPRDAQNTTSYEVRDQLKSLLNQRDLPASARVTAARTLAEMQGLIGRHQAAPSQPTSPVHALSRDELVTELERLRTLHGLGLIT